MHSMIMHCCCYCVLPGILANNWGVSPEKLCTPEYYVSHAFKSDFGEFVDTIRDCVDEDAVH